MTWMKWVSFLRRDGRIESDNLKVVLLFNLSDFVLKFIYFLNSDILDLSIPRTFKRGCLANTFFWITLLIMDFWVKF